MRLRFNYFRSGREAPHAVVSYVMECLESTFELPSRYYVQSWEKYETHYPTSYEDK